MLWLKDTLKHSTADWYIYKSLSLNLILESI